MAIEPSATAPPATAGNRFNESARKELTADEVHFITKGNTIYAFLMGWPEKLALIKPLATTTNSRPQKSRM